MPDTIIDGRGRGNVAHVNDEGRFVATTMAQSTRAHISREHGQAYSWSSGLHTLSAINTWHWALWWKVTSTTYDLHISNFEISWNGGSTNFNRPLEVKNVLPTAGAPTANHTAVTPSNNNKTSSNSAGLTVYKWDGVAAGMTNSAGPSGGNQFYSQGTYQKQFDDAVISPLNEHVGLMVQSPEVGNFSLSVAGYFVEKGVEM